MPSRSRRSRAAAGRAVARLAALAWAFVAASVGGCMLAPTRVTRVVNGREITGSFVAPDAYADYAQGAYLEERGDLDRAIAAYRRAAASDGDSPEIWTRLGAVLCKRGSGEATVAFARALESDSGFEPAWRERAVCDRAHGQWAQALAGALHAVALDPSRQETTLLVADLQVRRGDPHAAARWITALALRDPDSKDPWHSAREAVPPGDALDEALRRGDLDAARVIAVRQRVRDGELALRAATLGASEAALRQADATLLADPKNTDARIAAIVAADTAGHPEDLKKWLTDVPDGADPPGELGIRLLGRVLGHRVGEAAERAWLDRFSAQPKQEIIQKPPSANPGSVEARGRIDPGPEPTRRGEK